MTTKDVIGFQLTYATVLWAWIAVFGLSWLAILPAAALVASFMVIQWDEKRYEVKYSCMAAKMGLVVLLAAGITAALLPFCAIADLLIALV